MVEPLYNNHFQIKISQQASGCCRQVRDKCINFSKILRMFIKQVSGFKLDNTLVNPRPTEPMNAVLTFLVKIDSNSLMQSFSKKKKKKTLQLHHKIGKYLE